MKISCIIPAYNEEKSIANTLRAALQVPEIFEIIVIDDCSTDATQEIIRSFSGIKLLKNEGNSGKSKSIARGIEASTGSHLFLLDADLLGLEPESIRSLLAPIQNNRADIVISFRGNTPRWFKKLVNIEILSGDRVIPSSLVREHLEEINTLSGFSLEVFLNKLILQNKLRIQSVPMNDVRNDFKWRKRGTITGIRGEVRMWLDIFDIVSPLDFVRQNIHMRKLLVEEIS